MSLESSWMTRWEHCCINHQIPLANTTMLVREPFLGMQALLLVAEKVLEFLQQQATLSLSDSIPIMHYTVGITRNLQHEIHFNYAL